MLWNPAKNWDSYFKRQSEAICATLKPEKLAAPKQAPRKFPLSGPNSPKR